MDAALPDVDVDAGSDDGSAGRRWARHQEIRRRRRLRVAAGLAVAGVVTIAVGLSWHPGSHSKSVGTQPSTANGSVTVDTAKPPSTAPGGVGVDPRKTGLPAVPAEGGRVRTGTKEQGCFGSMREYLDAWDKTGNEPDPCFTTQSPAEQPQPDGVVRSYNGEKF